MLKLSIIIPMKNEESYIGLCLASIRETGFPKDSYEIICVDNGSDDKTVELARAQADKVFVILEESIAYLRNYGANNASGPCLAFLDADCVVDKDWFLNASVYLDDPNVAAFGSLPVIPEKATWVEETLMLNWSSHNKDGEEVSWLGSAHLFIKKSVFFEVGGFNQNLKTCEDVDLCYRIVEKHRIISDRKIKVIHLREPKSLSELFKKEVWHGKSNLAGFITHKFRLSELPSIIMPLYCLLVVVCAPFCLFLFENKILSLVLSLLLFSIPAVLKSVVLTMRSGKYNYLPKAIVVYIVYFSARAVSLIGELPLSEAEK